MEPKQTLLFNNNKFNVFHSAKYKTFLNKWLARVASVSVANFDVLAAWKLGQEQKKERGPRGKGNACFSPLPLPALSFFFCSHPNFRAAKTSKFAMETLPMQAKMTLPDLGGGQLYHTTSKILQKATYNPDYWLNISFDIPLYRLKKWWLFWMQDIICVVNERHKIILINGLSESRLYQIGQWSKTFELIQSE